MQQIFAFRQRPGNEIFLCNCTCLHHAKAVIPEDHQSLGAKCSLHCNAIHLRHEFRCNDHLLEEPSTTRWHMTPRPESDKAVILTDPSVCRRVGEWEPWPNGHNQTLTVHSACYLVLDQHLKRFQQEGSALLCLLDWKGLRRQQLSHFAFTRAEGCGPGQCIQKT